MRSYEAGLLAKLHLAYLCGMKADREMKEALTTLPSTIYGIYDDILEQLYGKNLESVNELKVILQYLYV